MGRARELSMGPPRKRSTATATTGDFAALRRLTTAADPDLTEFAATLARVAAQRSRFRFAEGAVYNDACARYTAITGEPYGSPTGTY